MLKKSFRVMKSELDVHPIHFQKETSAKGYFIICYGFIDKNNTIQSIK